MSRVVLDTNVVVAAFAARGLCESVFESSLEKHVLIISGFLLDELKEKLIRKIKLPEESVDEILKFYASNSECVIPSKIDKNACRDPEDIPVLGTCLRGKAEFLVSGDADLLVLGKIGKTIILNPRQFYELQISSSTP